MCAVAFEEPVGLHLRQVIAELVKPVALSGQAEVDQHGLVEWAGAPAPEQGACVQAAPPPGAVTSKSNAVTYCSHLRHRSLLGFYGSMLLLAYALKRLIWVPVENPVTLARRSIDFIANH
jgi:hypothetical protein